MENIGSCGVEEIESLLPFWLFSSAVFVDCLVLFGAEHDDAVRVHFADDLGVSSEGCSHGFDDDLYHFLLLLRVG